MHIQESSDSGLSRPLPAGNPIAGWLEIVAEEVEIPGFRLARTASLAAASAAEPSPQWVLVYEHDSLPVTLHVRIAYTASEMRSGWIAGDIADRAGSHDDLLPPQTELVIFTYRNFIVNIMQRADRCADRRIMQLAVGAVSESLRRLYRDF